MAAKKPPGHHPPRRATPAPKKPPVQDRTAPRPPRSRTR